jgi:hypothetical protein
MSDRRQCGNCRFYAPAQPHKTAGECRRYAPSAHLHQSTHWAHWCGDWEYLLASPPDLVPITGHRFNGELS